MSSIYKKEKPGKEINFRQRSLVFIDLETTGLDQARHEIIEIACLVVDPKTLKIKKRYVQKVKPEHLETAAPSALKVNKFSPEKWRGARPLGQVLKEVNQLAPGGLFIGWNISLDSAFLEKAARNQKTPLNYDYHWLDLNLLAYLKLFSHPKPKQLKLTQVCQALGVPRGKAHTAMGDALATLRAFRLLRKKSL